MNSDSHTISEEMLEVDKGHSLYVQEWGSKTAKTTFIFLHGGPGSGCHDGYKEYFNPQKNRVIFFDQRGAGKSTPSGLLSGNTTNDLINDINTIATKYQLENFVLVGGSWGSTLALAYALKWPTKVIALILRGIFTGSQSEIDVIDKGHFKAFFPDVWQNLLDKTPPQQHDDPVAYHVLRALSDDPTAIRSSAYAMSELEGSLARLDDRVVPEDIETFSPESTRIELWYTSQRCFMPNNYILNNASKLTMPVWLIQGRYDAICPPITAYALSKSLPNNKLIWTLAGHSGNDRANFEATKIAIASFD